MELELEAVHCWLGNCTMENREKASGENIKIRQINWEILRRKLTSTPGIRGVAATAKSGGAKNTEDCQKCPHGVRLDFEARLELKCICVRFISPPVTSSTSPTSWPLASEVELCPRCGTCC